MIFRSIMLSMLVAAAGCGGMAKMGKMNQIIEPGVDVSRIKRITVIANGAGRSDAQVAARARARLTKAGVTLVKRPGSWESDSQAVKDICVQRERSSDNVDGVVMVNWDRLTLHDCVTGKIGTEISGNYAGIDAMVDKLIQYMGAASQSK